MELINEIPGSLEGMMTRLILELDQDILFEQQIRQGKYHWSIRSEIDNEIKCRKITMISSIHETGHLRDILLFLKSGSQHLLDTSMVDKNNPYIKPFRSTTSSLLGHSSNSSSLGGGSSSPLTFVDTLPWWSIYLPWWLYSRNTRKFLQYVILIYSFFSIVWASWQLYRHVQFIHIVLEPIVELCREYLNDIMELLDAILATLTYYWTTLLSPLNIFRSLLVLPVWGSLLQVKTLFGVLLGPLSKCLSPATSCLIFVWRGVMSSKLALQSLDISKIQRNYITNLIFSCLRAAVLGLANLVGYSKSRTKQKQAIKQQAKYRGGGSVTSPSNMKYYNSVPVYYNSPLLRQESPLVLRQQDESD